MAGKEFGRFFLLTLLQRGKRVRRRAGPEPRDLPAGGPESAGFLGFSLNKKLKKYLQTRAVQGPWKQSNASRTDYNAAIVIPALAEAETLPQTLASLAKNRSEYLRRTLIIVVVNNRADCPVEELQDNQRTLCWLQTDPCPDLNLAWVDAVSIGSELPAREGVGLARKIGFDLALQQLDWRRQPLLISLDADTLVDENYLSAIFTHFAKSEYGAVVIPFRHQLAAEPQQEQAIRLYELYLRSYQFGLQQAGSPYAYHSIGSAFACRAEAYLAAGGMNRRHAAEDFYFLQQLAKTAGVEILSGTVVQPSARFSCRVPFGTGRAVHAQVEGEQGLFRFVPVPVFVVLQRWLQLVAAELESPAAQLLAGAAEISSELQSFLLELKFVQNWSRLQSNHAEPASQLKAFHCWFDGLRTRQLLTRLDPGDELRVSELVEELLSWGGYPEVKSLDDQLQLLESLQDGTKN